MVVMGVRHERTHEARELLSPSVVDHLSVQGGAFGSAEVPFPTVDNGVARSRRKFTRPQFCKQTLQI